MLLPRIETERLILRTYRAEDLETVYRMCSDADITRFFHEDYAVERANVLASLPRRRNRWKTQGFGQFGVFDKTAARLIGYCGFQYLDESSDVEIYYGFFKEFWGKGFATESARAGLRFGFEQANLNRIAAVTHPENTASQKVLLRLGMKRQSGKQKFYGVDAAFFIVTRAEFKVDSSAYKLDFEDLDELFANG